MFDREKLHLFRKLDRSDVAQTHRNSSLSVTGAKRLRIHLYLPSLAAKLITNAASYVFAANILACLANVL